MKRVLLIFSVALMLCAGCTRGQWLDEIVAQRDEQEEVVPILLDAYDKGLFVTSVEVVERTNKYLHHSEYDRRYRMTFSDNNIVEIEIGHPSDDKFYKKRGQAYISEILTSGEGGVEFLVWLPNEEWKQKHNHLVCEDGESVRFSFRICNIDVISNIYYTSTDGNVVTPYATTVFGATIVSNTYENGQGVITFNGEVSEIGGLAFRNCTSLANITLPSSVRSIGMGAFHYCTNLTSINIPNGISTIEYDTFSECKNLQNIEIPESVTVIDKWAFHLCSSLTEVIIPKGVKTIGQYAFEECPKLARVYCKPTTPPTLTSPTTVFKGNASGRKIYVPAESVEAYKATEGWSNYAGAIVGYNF